MEERAQRAGGELEIRVGGRQGHQPSGCGSPVAEAIDVLVVDDHAVVREGLRTFLELQDGIEVVGEAADGEAAVREAERLRPDVILIDLVMPKLDGVGAMRELRRRLPATSVIVLTSFADDERLLGAIRAGAAGYLLKNAEPQEVARAVRAASAGQALLDPAVAARVVESIADRDVGRRRREPDAARARGAGADRPRALEQADRPRARDRREDGQDPRRPRAGEARGHATAPRRRVIAVRTGLVDEPLTGSALAEDHRDVRVRPGRPSPSRPRRSANGAEG